MKMYQTIEENHLYEEKAMVDEFLWLTDYYDWDAAEDDGKIVVDGKEYEYEITLDEDIPDNLCMRVMIDGYYYHFG